MFDVHVSLMLMQDGQALPPVPGEAPVSAAPGAGTTAAPNGAGTAGAGSGGGGTGGGTPATQPFGSQMFIMIGLLILLMFVFSMSGTRREKKKREALLNAIKKHDRVQTIGGVIGSVVEIKPEYVILKVDESSNTRITFARSAIQQVLSSDSDAVPAKADAQ